VNSVVGAAVGSPLGGRTPVGGPQAAATRATPMSAPAATGSFEVLRVTLSSPVS
jgi:hypothetical protein